MNTTLVKLIQMRPLVINNGVTCKINLEDTTAGSSLSCYTLYHEDKWKFQKYFSVIGQEYFKPQNFHVLKG